MTSLIAIGTGLAALLTALALRHANVPRRLAQRRTLRALRQAFAEATIGRDADGVTIDVDEHRITVPLDYLARFEHRDGATSTLVEELQAVRHRNTLHGLELLDAMSRVLPVPLPVQRPRISGELALATRPIADGLEVAYVLDTPRSTLWVTRDDVERWNLDADQLHDAALTNLWDATQGAIVLQEDVDGREIYQIRQGDGLDSSRLLLPGLWRQLADSCGEPLVLCAPSRDRIYAAPVDQPTSIARLADHASGDWVALDRPVSPSFWIWEEGALQRWGAHA